MMVEFVCTCSIATMAQASWAHPNFSEESSSFDIVGCSGSSDILSPSGEVSCPRSSTAPNAYSSSRLAIRFLEGGALGNSNLERNYQLLESFFGTVWSFIRQTVAERLNHPIEG